MSTIIKADATGAVILPAELCRAAGVTPGADLVAEVQDGRIVIERARLPIWERIIALPADCPRRLVSLQQPPYTKGGDLSSSFWGDRHGRHD